MKKIFLTSRSKEELVSIIEKMMQSNSEIRKEQVLMGIRFVRQDELRISTGKVLNYWKLDLDIPGKIIVKRYLYLIDWIFVITIGIVNGIIVSPIFLCDMSLNGIWVLMGILLIEYLYYYFFYVFTHIKKMERVVNKFLGGY